jgi:hypothetical protein
MLFSDTPVAFPQREDLPLTVELIARSGCSSLTDTQREYSTKDLR